MLLIADSYKLVETERAWEVRLTATLPRGMVPSQLPDSLRPPPDFRAFQLILIRLFVCCSRSRGSRRWPCVA